MGLRVVVVGGGIVGCMTAMMLTQRGCEVTVIERNQIASQTSGEASWAGAGVLCSLLPWMYGDTVNELVTSGAAQYPDICKNLLNETGVDPEYWQCGMRIQPPYDHATASNWAKQYGVEIEQSGHDLLLPSIAQVRNPNLMLALKQWLLQNNVTLLEQTQLTPLIEKNLSNSGVIEHWQTADGANIEADAYVVTSGAWSFELLQHTAQKLNIKPMRGQILLYKLAPQTLPNIIYKNGFYMLQRKDGYLLAGSTLEDVGFDTEVTQAAQQEIQAKAEAILPALKNVEIVKHWSGLRPGTPDNIPTIAAHPTINNLYLNTGHFRYGLTMAPESARRIGDIVLAAH